MQLSNHPGARETGFLDTTRPFQEAKSYVDGIVPRTGLQDNAPCSRRMCYMSRIGFEDRKRWRKGGSVMDSASDSTT